MRHRKKANNERSVEVNWSKDDGSVPSFMSGMIGVARMTRPLIETSLSISIQVKIVKS